jgi:hypothetical protein
VGDCRHTLWHFWCADVTPAQTHARDFSAIHARSLNAGDDHFIVNQPSAVHAFEIVASGFGDGAVTCTVTFRGVHQNVVSFPHIIDDLTHGTSTSAAHARNIDAQSLSESPYDIHLDNDRNTDMWPLLQQDSTSQHFYTVYTPSRRWTPQIVGTEADLIRKCSTPRYKHRLLTLDRGYIDAIYLSLCFPSLVVSTKWPGNKSAAQTPYLEPRYT